MGALWERHYPWLISLVSSTILLYIGVRPNIKGFEKVLDGVITFSSIVVGFLAALLAIIMSLSESEVIKHVYSYREARSTGKKKDKVFFIYFRWAIYLGFISVVFSIIMYIVYTEPLSPQTKAKL